MRLLGRSSTASAVFATALVLSLFSTATLAQDNKDSKLPDLSTVTNNQDDKTTVESAKPTAATNSDAKNSNTKSGDRTGTSPRATISNTGVAGSSRTGSAPVISITGGATATDRPVLTGIPKLPGGFSYPPASVPPTQDAPYMRVSSLPEGTVFIVVGAFLGFVAVLVLLWRTLVVWSLHRSVKRATKHQDIADTKALFRTPAAPVFKYTDRESTLSLSNLSGTGKGGRKHRPSTGGHMPAGSQSLFYSPTAGAAGAGLAHAGNRGSNYLPAGYYAAGASAPGNGAGMTHIGSQSRENINLSNLRPHSQGYSRGRSMGQTPPDSPSSAFPPNLGHRLNPSTSTLDLNPRTTAARAPSAYLENLFDEAGGAPGQSPHGTRY